MKNWHYFKFIMPKESRCSPRYENIDNTVKICLACSYTDFTGPGQALSKARKVEGKIFLQTLHGLLSNPSQSS
jgi:hypothetical protein